MTKRLAVSVFAAFAASCSESTGPEAITVEVQVVTSGPTGNADPDGYSLFLGTSEYPIPANGKITISDLALGTYETRVADVAANCTSVSVTPRILAVSEYSRQVKPRVTINATCSADLGTVRVTATTSGPDQDTDGYMVVFRGKAMAPAAIALNGNAVGEGAFPSGELEVGVEGIAENCRLAEGQPRTIRIEHAKFLDLSVNIVCVAKGSIAITAGSVSEHPDANGYTYIVKKGQQQLRTGQVAPGGTILLAGLSPGDYTVALTDVAIHCDPPPSVAIAVVLAAVSPVSFQVPCGKPFEIAYVEGTGNQAKIVIVTTDGRFKRAVLNDGETALHPQWSPDGRRIAFTRVRGLSQNISVADENGGNRIEFDAGSGFDQHPAWSPDGSEIAFVRTVGPDTNIYLMNIDGSNRRRITNGAAVDMDPAWSPDGNKIVFTRLTPSLGASLYVMNSDGSEVRRLTTGTSDRAPAWSPDGKRIAFARQHTPNNLSIQVIDPSGDNAIPLVAGLTSAGDPAWSPDGKALAFSGKRQGCDYYYYYYCEPQIDFVRLDGTGATLGEGSYNGLSSPTWRPRP